MSTDELAAFLVAKKRVVGSPKITPLSGGVSSEIFLVEENSQAFVVKRALPKLKVKDDWFADPIRNQIEQEYLQYVGRFLPGNVPKIIFSEPEACLFGMEYLGGGFLNWNSMWLTGQANPEHARMAGRILGTIHKQSWNDASIRFAPVQNFFALRIEPYLLTTGSRHPRLRKYFEVESQRLSRVQLALVHGDFSPKNILIHENRMVLV